jgi:PPM family protein phosphatase
VTQLRAGGLTDTGRVRQVNQDAPLLAGNAGLWAVADGMGGHNGGEIASVLAVEALRTNYTGEERSLDALLGAATAANTAINDAAHDDPDLRGMGTTLVAIAHTDDDELAFVNIGDSRIYLFRDSELRRLTIDHSLVEELVREGQITPEEARTHPKRNIVTRALGIDAIARIDHDTIIPYTGDRYVLCSDGLFNEVEEDRIASVLRRLADPDDAASELVRLANEGGGRDNITVVILDVVDDGGRAEAGSAEALSTASSSRDDPAGFMAVAAVAPPRDAEPTITRRQRRQQRKAERPKRFTWRVAVFVVLLLVVAAAAVGAIYQEARGGYFVAFDENGFVTVYRGSPGGVLWFDPVVERTTDITRDEVPPNLRDELDAGLELSDAARVESFLENQATTTTTSTSTTTTTSTSTSTTVPPAVVVAPTTVP